MRQNMRPTPLFTGTRAPERGAFSGSGFGLEEACFYPFVYKGLFKGFRVKF